MNNSYKAAGVDVEAGYKSVELIKGAVARTNIAGVMGGLGDFGGLFDLSVLGLKEPVLVSGTDGVGTKLKLAFLLDKHDTIGQDCVAMCVNDIICSGAKPLFFLDYLAVGKNVPEKVAEIVSGVARACEEAGCALVGGETAEMPGFYAEGEYDIAGFAVGAVEKSKLLNKENVKAGQALVAVKSSGVHSNGFSLIRKVFGSLIGEYAKELLEPTKIYVKQVLPLVESGLVKSVSHITGGGFYENIPRMLPQGLGAKIDKSAVQVLPIFKTIQKYGNIPEKEMFGTFNMGVGMVLATDRADEVVKELNGEGYIIGEIIQGEGVELV